jgi:hypothetical protein
MTPVAAEGLPLTAALATLVGDGADAIAELIMRLHMDPGLHRAMGDAAFRLIGSQFSPAQVLARLRDALGTPRPIAAAG